MAKLREIFEKPVDRAIEGVIKADDDASLRIEIEEYVITKEIETQLDKFLHAYNHYQTANGVWISGFFGSGKSHLLKMLAMLLENRDVDGTRALDLFLPKLGDNAMLQAELTKAVSQPSQSILFNIDQKADVISKQDVDALLSVFQKVFDDMCGYYGKQPHIAQFERDLDSRGLLVKFRDIYARIAGKTWDRGREQALLEGLSIAKAYAEASNTDTAEAQGLLSKYRQDFRSSIEDFAEKVGAYIATQAKGFRLNFFVDEVGQYIADNVKLMTNLQTIAESLNTKCRGQAWIIVTAQQDMGSVIGEMNQNQANDFSKIQARFANRMPLNSADVAEVIQRRLLKKTSAGVDILSSLYQREQGNLKTLFDFTDGSVKLKNFKDEEHFVQSYPFIPYQYELFQQSIQNLSQQNAFEGKHSSVGERSMLGVFQDVAKRLADIEIGAISSFDQMFEGIRTALKSSVQQSILLAERNLDSPFATRVLKALFLVKYVKAFKPTVRNVAILMLDEFDLDQAKHRRRVEDALALLEGQTYIQRNGQYFEFLTDEEKDVEQDIKTVSVDSSEVSRQLEELIFDGVLKNRKIRHEASSQEFSYGRLLDDRLCGRDQELSINVITPFHPHAANLQAIAMESMSRAELAVVMPSDKRFVDDLLMYKKTEKYVRQARQSGQREAVERIIRDKADQNGARLKELTTKCRAMLSEAGLIVRGEPLDIRAEDPQVRIERAFQTLVDKIYTNLPMLQGVDYKEQDIAATLRRGNDGMFDEVGTSLTEPEQDVLNFAQLNGRQGLRTTVKVVLERFEKKPYGWSMWAILATIARLVSRGKIEAKLDGAVLENDDLEKRLRNTINHSNLVLDLQLEFTAGQIKALREFYRDFFDQPVDSTEAKTLGSETSEAFDRLASEIKAWRHDIKAYPFLESLAGFDAPINDTLKKSYAWYITDLPKMADTLFDLKDKVIDPIRRFMNGPQRAIYDDARHFLSENQANLGYGLSDAAAAITGVLDDKDCYKGSAVQQIKGSLDDLKIALETLLKRERDTATSDIADMRSKIADQEAFLSADETVRSRIDRAFGDAAREIQQARLVAVIRERTSNFRDITYNSLLGLLEAPPPSPPTESAGAGVAEPRATPFVAAPAAAPIIVSMSSVRVKFEKAVLADEADVDAYLVRLKQTLVSELSAGKKISV
ncbi:BREX system P-loop protein BrxC [Asticcacaulis sp. AC402]|uniref:BREX system P-loop protein BrxC n=1 Tax=Asticcacaulis sp. AC402 TaxID=1282361 RepID=UPI0003C3CA6C|nr:BREX system P-loop protein BrxC [Asticcacaulis sp. AC402]ESQ75037.1 hypothetical protein ABAC402_11575 [Asticcacaulis sp. AC402]